MFVRSSVSISFASASIDARSRKPPEKASFLWRLDRSDVCIWTRPCPLRTVHVLTTKSRCLIPHSYLNKSPNPILHIEYALQLRFVKNRSCWPKYLHGILIRRHPILPLTLTAVAMLLFKIGAEIPLTGAVLSAANNTDWRAGYRLYK
uniref:Fibroin heavy chain-like n=1 Tax=Parascaris univalens TaxID=6257 RepID=A0A915C7D6_PARUN